MAKANKHKREKADVILFEDDKEWRCSIKTSEADFSQLERCWVSDFTSRLNIPIAIANILQLCIIEKSRKSKSDVFIQEQYQQRIIEYFETIKRDLYIEVFTRREKNLNYLVICDYRTTEGSDKLTWYIVRMDTVISKLSKERISVSKKGVLYLCDFITMQRKGGNGAKYKNMPKDSPNHPGNQLQFKIKPLSLLNYMEKESYQLI